MSYEYEKKEIDDDSNDYNELSSINSFNEYNSYILEPFPFPFNKSAERYSLELNEEKEEEKGEEKEEEKEEKQNKKLNKKFITIRKRGRGAKPDNLLKKKRIHDKFSDDNKIRKINVHFYSFLLNFINTILEYTEINQEFKSIDYKYKNILNKNNFSSLKHSNICDVLSLDISPKFKTMPNETNKNVCEQSVKNPVIKNLLNEKYFNLFKDIYYINKRNINMEKYGLKQIIHLPIKIKMFYEFIEKNRKKYDEKSNDGDEYAISLKECTRKYFLN